MARNSRVSNIVIGGRRVGRVADAIAAHDGDLVNVGHGLMRTVYISADNSTVYKIPRRSGNAANESEHYEMSRLRNHPVGGRYALPTTLYYVDGHAVLAMPFVPNDSSDADYQTVSEFRNILQTELYFVRDMHDGNYRVDARGQIRITDLGMVAWGGRSSDPWEDGCSPVVSTVTDEDFCDCTICRAERGETITETVRVWCPICGNTSIWGLWTRCTDCRMVQTIVSAEDASERCPCPWCENARAGLLRIVG